MEGVDVGILKVLDDWLELSVEDALGRGGVVEVFELRVHFILL